MVVVLMVVVLAVIVAFLVVVAVNSRSRIPRNDD